MKNTKKYILLAAGLIAVAAITRIISFEMHWFNLAPIAAVGLFAGSVIKEKKYAFLFAVLAQLAGDIYIELFTNWQGFYGIDQAFVYLSLLAVTALGFLLTRRNALNVLGFSVGASVLFFIISNLGVWVAIETGKADLFGYGQGISGLVNTFIAAVPFYKNTLIGTVAGSVALFGLYNLFEKGFSLHLQSAKV